MKTKNKNAMQVIFPYCENGQWMFDDDRVGLIREPFVHGIDDMLDLLTSQAGIKKVSNGVKLIFSHQSFPDSVELVHINEDNGGNWYRCPKLDNMEGWLCPALFHFFEKAPAKLYVKVSSLKKPLVKSLSSKVLGFISKFRN